MDSHRKKLPISAIFLKNIKAEYFKSIKTIILKSFAKPLQNPIIRRRITNSLNPHSLCVFSFSKYVHCPFSSRSLNRISFSTLCSLSIYYKRNSRNGTNTRKPVPDVMCVCCVVFPSFYGIIQCRVRAICRKKDT